MIVPCSEIELKTITFDELKLAYIRNLGFTEKDAELFAGLVLNPPQRNLLHPELDESY